MARSKSQYKIWGKIGVDTFRERQSHTEPINEARTHRAICGYLRERYPDIEFYSTMDGELSEGKRVKMSYLKTGNGWSDLLIFEPTKLFNGLSLEIKHVDEQLLLRRNATKPMVKEWVWLGRGKNKKKHGILESKIRQKGDWANPHIQEQAEMLEYMRRCGWCAEFGVGFRNSLRIIDGYFSNDLELIKSGIVFPVPRIAA